MVRGWPGRTVRDSGWVSCSQFTPVENISFWSWMSYLNNELICFLMGWMFSHKASPEPAARSSSSTATENMVCVEAELEEDVLFYTWHLIRLSESRNTPSLICKFQLGGKCWLRWYTSRMGKDHRSFTRFFALFDSVLLKPYHYNI